ncbi:multiple epidermal growth factor-like domains protein 11 [Ostrinia furnacalis]|uniref:multiple epidermal growth factor-like domains protein 11 n=1 Tax=Ostrinia furnacalis TaxID=93504 RepID=UPI00103EB635|nr:multiple epidermal growth factor-like domains protein 11 [Ostrinia furnacalis]
MLRLPVLCLVVLSAVIVREVTTLNAGDVGVCMTKISSRTSKRVTFTKLSNKWCGKRKCVVRVARIQPVVEVHDRLICCSGFQYQAESDDCAPLCTTGCLGGRCVAPDVCQCDPPAYLEPGHQNTCVHPVCDPPCLNADCTSNNTCTCHQNFQPFNSTHCHNCGPGYSVAPNLTCNPICDPECDGECTGPNVCSCSPGYIAVGHKCEPVCDPVCVNSKCVAPNSCSCFDGYSAVNRSYCAPVCERCDTKCTAPNVCECFEGYEHIDGTCRPICNSSCENGYCSGPNECSCNEGYKKNETTGVCSKPCEKYCPGTCTVHGECRCVVQSTDLVPRKVQYKCGPRKKQICTTMKKEKVIKTSYICCDGWTYLDGKCVAKCDPVCLNAQCTDTNKCTCDSGFVPLNETLCVPPCPPDQYNDLSVPEFPCRSKCTQPCSNGTCVDFNKCSCNSGFKQKDQFTCEPKCGACEHGVCEAPEYECTCLSGYEKGEDGRCEPICEGCEQGKCVAPNDCQCHDGYRRENNKCEPVCHNCEHGSCRAPNDCQCHDGYRRENNTCEPICYDCEHGRCVAPSDCQCNDGYRREENKCNPVCDDCEYGKCVAPNDCQCQSGYRRKNNKCEPVCDETCQNGLCTAPNECTCKRNHSHDATNKFKCNPICDNACVNSLCIAPNTCMCIDGFESSGNNWTCRPSCKSCDNGQCLAPNECVCNKGYEKNDKDICVPVCKLPCTHGVCTQPDLCVCNPGYKMDDISKTCKPTCDQSCVNGTCVAVNECECFSGYEKTDVGNICKPICAHTSCVNGDCVAPDVCQCRDGYEFVNGTCGPVPLMNCKDCEGLCKDGVCACPNGSLCHQAESASTDVESTPTLAGLQLTWALGGAVGILLVVIMMVVMARIWRQRQRYDKKNPDKHDAAYGSVLYPLANTLVPRDPTDVDPDYDDVELNKQTDVGLLGHIPTEDCVERI